METKTNQNGSRLAVFNPEHPVNPVKMTGAEFLMRRHMTVRLRAALASHPRAADGSLIFPVRFTAHQAGGFRLFFSRLLRRARVGGKATLPGAASGNLFPGTVGQD